MLREYNKMKEKIKNSGNVFGIYYIKKKCKRIALVIKKTLQTKIIVSEKPDKID